MFEKRGTFNRRSKLGVGLLVAGVLLGGCSEIADAADGMALERCFEKPTPITEAAPPPMEALPTLDITKSRKGKVNRDPGPLRDKIRAKVLGAIINIEYSEDDKIRAGSGFLTTDRKGNKVAITAAHVASSNDLKAMQVIDVDGNKTGVKGGCYMYEVDGKFKSPSPRFTAIEHEVGALDLAILKLAEPEAVGDTTLSLTNEVPTRGSGNATLANFQGQPVGPREPIFYNAISLGEIAQHRMAFLTGVQSQRNCQPDASTYVSACATQPGASGGAVVNRNGEVFAISNNNIATNEGYGYMSKQDLEPRYNVDANFKTGTGTGNWPVGMIAMDATVIMAALDQSPKLQ